jgi:hypothetical protein
VSGGCDNIKLRGDGMDVLTGMRRQKRNAETRVTKENKDKLIRQMNKSAVDFGLPKISKNASVKDVARYKNQYVERLTYDIVTLAIQQGKDIVAEIESRDLKKSDDFQTKRLGQFGKELAQAKRQSDNNLTKEEKAFLDRGNNNIKGYGNYDVITEFEKTKNPKQAKALIDEIRSQNAKEIFFMKQLGLLEKVFQKVEVFREDDLTAIKERLSDLEMKDALNHTNYLLKSLDIFDSDKQNTRNDDETELANARLDDLMTQFGLKTSSSRKAIKTTLDKYKKKTE